MLLTDNYVVINAFYCDLFDDVNTFEMQLKNAKRTRHLHQTTTILMLNLFLQLGRESKVRTNTFVQFCARVKVWKTSWDGKAIFVSAIYM